MQSTSGVVYLPRSETPAMCVDAWAQLAARTESPSPRRRADDAAMAHGCDAPRHRRRRLDASTRFSPIFSANNSETQHHHASPPPPRLAPRAARESGHTLSLLQRVSILQRPRPLRRAILGNSHGMRWPAVRIAPSWERGVRAAANAARVNACAAPARRTVVRASGTV